jgi:hypothetical protein
MRVGTDLCDRIEFLVDTCAEPEDLDAAVAEFLLTYVRNGDGARALLAAITRERNWREHWSRDNDVLLCQGELDQAMLPLTDSVEHSLNTWLAE